MTSTHHQSSVTSLVSWRSLSIISAVAILGIRTYPKLQPLVVNVLYSKKFRWYEQSQLYWKGSIATSISKRQSQKCGKSFNHQSNLTTHLLTHTDVTDYSCVHCNKQFRCNCDLRRHILTHCHKSRILTSSSPERKSERNKLNAQEHECSVQISSPELKKKQYLVSRVLNPTGIYHHIQYQI